MGSYTTLDMIDDLTKEEMDSSVRIGFGPAKPNEFGYDQSWSMSSINDNANLRDIHLFLGKEGATYDILSFSFFDPFGLKIYDENGNTIELNSEFDDFDLSLNGINYSTDYINQWKAPYSGIYYIDASWNQGLFYTGHGLSIFEDNEFAVNSVSRNDLNVIYNWAENEYKELLPQNKESEYIYGFYARKYENFNAVGEKDGNIYFYDGTNSFEDGQLILVGAAIDLFNLANS